MTKEFNTHSVGSAYSLGTIDSPIKVVMLHGNGSSADEVRDCGEILSQYISDAEIIIPNEEALKYGSVASL
jgi:hypothetical protein